jgi:predicted DNA-binding transcriptional regulator AlpA
MTPLMIYTYADLLRMGLANDRSTIWRWVKAGQFPEPIKLSPNRTVFRRSEVDAWLAARGL